MRFYTDFSALNFISGSSSLRILKTLIKDGVFIYHVANLHAKVIMVDDVHFSIGSQNLTIKGRRRNIEASFVSGSSTPSGEVKEFFADLHRSARPVSLEEILDLEALIGPEIKKFEKIRESADEVDDQIEREREKRRIEQLEKLRREQALRAAELVKKERSDRMKKILKQFDSFFNATPSSRLRASVHRMTNSSYNFNPLGSGTDSLRPCSYKQNFEQLLASVGVNPKRFSRYLLVNADNGKLGFVRFVKTRWTFFGSRVRPGERLSLCGCSWEVDITFDWTADGSLERNGSLALRAPVEKGRTVASVGFAFSTVGVDLEKLILTPYEDDDPWAPMIIDTTWEYSRISETLKTYLISHLTNPFKFIRNLTGQQAFSFFGSRSPTSFWIQAHRFGETAIFSAKKAISG
ncbi:MAG: phospholipase D-like domain-containing protein [Chthoniobacterales bacterium]